MQKVNEMTTFRFSAQFSGSPNGAGKTKRPAGVTMSRYLSIAFSTCRISPNDGPNLMNTQSQQFLQSALQLPESERAEIAASLIRSLDTELDEDVDAAWAAEIQRRIQSIDNGDLKLIPWDEVIDQMVEAKNGSSAN